mmetsp:Transcript_9444/g.20522  ORF Transcript_9444/g.20522 Transcript_9444/m.20522 type:complete len:282 (+) Transcript_9444:1382-2227(+)
MTLDFGRVLREGLGFVALLEKSFRREALLDLPLVCEALHVQAPRDILVASFLPFHVQLLLRLAPLIILLLEPPPYDGDHHKRVAHQVLQDLLPALAVHPGDRANVDAVQRTVAHLVLQPPDGLAVLLLLLAESRRLLGHWLQHPHRRCVALYGHVYLVHLVLNAGEDLLVGVSPGLDTVVLLRTTEIPLGDGLVLLVGPVLRHAVAFVVEDGTVLLSLSRGFSKDKVFRVAPVTWSQLFARISVVRVDEVVAANGIASVLATKLLGLLLGGERPSSHQHLL